MGTAFDIYASALVILVASALIGRAMLVLFGRRDATFLEPAYGIAILLAGCAVAIRLPGEDRTALALCAVLVIAAIAVLVVRRDRILTGALGASLPVVAFVTLIASFPFLASGSLGLFGVGVNNDMAMHLVFTDFLLDAIGPTPGGLTVGYPIGPHGVVAVTTKIVSAEPLRSFQGLLIAVPAMTGVASLAVLRDLRALPRIAAATLIPLAYLSASVLGIASFKELLAALFLIAFALTLRELARSPERGRWGLIVGLIVLCGGTIAAYSYPGLAWLGATFVIWAAAELLRVRSEDGPDAARELFRRSLRTAAPALILFGLAALTQLPRAIDFLNSGVVEIVQDTDSKLREAVSPLEALGAWPSGDWLLGTSDLGAYWLFGAIGVAALGYGVWWWLRERDLALPSALAASILIYLGTLVAAGLYVQAKALAVPASLVLLIILAAFAAPGGGWPKRVLAVAFIGLASYSTFLALRDAVVSPLDRFDELAGYREDVRGSDVVALTSDRYSHYYLRGSEVWSPARNAELRIPGRLGKEFRLPVDFDSLHSRDMERFDYAITTSADYQSAPPPNWEEVRRTDNYVLWKRTGTTPYVGVLAEASRPGRIFRCSNSKFRPLLKRDGIAITWPRPVIAKRLYWEPERELAPGESASQTIDLPRGNWQLSFQYQSPVAEVEVSAGDLTAVLPAGVEGAIPYRPDQGPFWRVGTVSSDGGPMEVTVRAKELSGIRKLLGVDAPAAIGNLTATRIGDLATKPFKQSCGSYLDHYYVGKPGALRAPGRVIVPIQPTR